MQDGRLRVVGAFAHGRKTGTFIFWNSSGARVAVIPYQDDDKAGTVALWYTVPGARRELQRKLEAPYVENKLHGIKRSWNPRGMLAGRVSLPARRADRCQGLGGRRHTATEAGSRSSGGRR